MYANQSSYDNAQASYDNAVEPGYWDEDDSCVYDAMKEDFDDEFVVTLYDEGNETINDLLLKVASSGSSDSNDVKQLVLALQDFYQSELEKYSDINYDAKYKELKDANDDY